jgi:hypothetical protein
VLVPWRAPRQLPQSVLHLPDWLRLKSLLVLSGEFIGEGRGCHHRHDARNDVYVLVRVQACGTDSDMLVPAIKVSGEARSWRTAG